ncbi:hypothetical protein MMC18_006393 [Xylographa bjoerkii]|nr:hypothetical protein [Xylographa bjoerkii]
MAQVMIPTFIRDLWVLFSIANRSEPIRGYAKSEYVGFREADGVIIARDPMDGELLAVVHGCRTTAVTSYDASSQQASRRLCFNIDRKSDVDVLDAQQAVTLFKAEKTAPPESPDQ